MTKNEVAATVAVVIGVLSIFYIIMYLMVKYAPAQQPTASNAVVEEKPFTKTRCDITGFGASSIIADEAKNGYVFNGRVSTFLCGENGLSFSLRQDPPTNNLTQE